jgi:hypothetical protein
MMRSSYLVNVLAEKRREGGHALRERQEHVVENVGGKHALLGAGIPLEASAVELDVPVREVIHVLEEARHHSVEPVGFHFLADKLNEARACSLQGLGRRA